MSQDPTNDRFFSDSFKALTGHPPFPWQSRLHDLLARGDLVRQEIGEVEEEPVLRSLLNLRKKKQLVRT